ncbi:MAG: ATP-binding protein [Terricaulis sp.]
MPAQARQCHAPPDLVRWLEALPTSVLGIDGDLVVVFANLAAEQLLAGAGRGLLEKSLEQIFGAEAPLAALVRRAGGQGIAVSETDVALSGPGFSLGRISITAAPVEQGFVALVLTPLPRARPHQGARLAAQTLAHEVRNPLAGIRAAAQLIAKSHDPRTNTLAKLICAEADRIHRLTKTIDAFANPAGERRRFSIHEALERIRLLVSSSAPDIVIVEEYDPSLPFVCGDFDQIVQALLNIAQNAAEALAGTPSPILTLRTSFRPGVRVRKTPTEAARAQLEVQITDNGPGLDQEILDRVFEPFVTTKPKGMGLGLAIAAEIVAAHDGGIEVSSHPGRTSFSITLPVGED